MTVALIKADKSAIVAISQNAAIDINIPGVWQHPGDVSSATMDALFIAAALL